MRLQQLVTGLARVLFITAVSVWMGGMAFFGIMTAPFVFRVARNAGVPEIAPEMVTAILGRFTWFTYVCAVLLLLAWLLEMRGSRATTGMKRWWVGQGACSIGALAIAFYLGLALFPNVVAGQKAVVPLFRKQALGQTLTPAESAVRAEFDKGHQSYNKLASLSVWLLLGSVIAFAARTSIETSRVREELG